LNSNKFYIVRFLAIFCFLFTQCGSIEYKELFGFTFDVGEKITFHHEFGGIQGDGLDVEIYKGNPEQYQRFNNLPDSFFAEYPKASLNINNFQKVCKWQKVPVQAKDKDAFKFAESAISGLYSKKSQKKYHQASEIFSTLSKHPSTIYAYFFDGDDIDFWMVNPQLCYFMYVSLYT